MSISPINNTFPYWQSIDNGKVFTDRMMEKFRQRIREISTPISVQTARAHEEKLKKWGKIDIFA